MKRTYVHYVLTLSLLVLAAFFLNIPYVAYGAFLFVGFYLLNKRRDFSYFIPLIVLSPFISSNASETLSYFYIYIGLLGVLLIFDFYKYRKARRFGSLGLGLFFLFDAAALSLFNAEQLLLGLQGLLLLGIIFLLYLYFVNTIDATKPFIIKLSFVFMISAWVLFIQQVSLALMDATSFLEATISLAWAQWYVYPFIYVMVIPLGALFTLKSRYLYFTMMTWLIAFIGLLLSAHIPSIFSGLVVMIGMLIYFYRNEKSYFKTISYMLAGLVLLPLLLDLIIPTASFTRMLLMVMDIPSAWSRFISTIIKSYELVLSHPILGRGGLYHMAILLDGDITSLDFQNLFFKTMSMGTLGFLAFMYLQYRKIRLILESEKELQITVFSILIVALLVQGIFTAIYYHPLFLVSIFLWMSVVESDAKQRRLKSR